jgi:hypothetical protein
MRDDLTIPPYNGGTTKASTKSPATEASASGQGSSKTFKRPLTALENLLANVESPVYLGARPGEGELTTKFSCKDAYTLFGRRYVLVCPHTKDGRKPNGSVHDLQPESKGGVEFEGNPTIVVGEERIGFERTEDDEHKWKRFPRPIYPPDRATQTIAWQEMKVFPLVRKDSDSESESENESASASE